MAADGGVGVPDPLRPGLPARPGVAVLVPASARRWTPRERDAAVLVRLREVMEYAYSTSTFYQDKWDAAGLKPADITSFEAFEQVPVVTKAEMRESQANHPPFGDYLCCDESEVHHIHGTSGTTGAPTAFALGRRDWEVIADNHARILWGMGVRPGDTVFVAALFIALPRARGARWPGAERLRCRVLPFGAGAQGMTARAVTWLARIEAGGVLRDAVVRAAPRRGRREGEDRPARVRAEGHVLLRRARAPRCPRSARRSRTRSAPR